MKGRKTGGRLKGTPNKATVEIKEIARRYALTAMRELARLATKAQSEQARIAAVKNMLMAHPAIDAAGFDEAHLKPGGCLSETDEHC